MTDVRRSITIRFAVTNVAMVVNFLTGLVLARLLDPEDVGIFSMTAVFVGIMHTFRDFGVVSYLLREKELTPEKIRAASGLLILTSWLIAVSLLLLAGPVAAFYGHMEVQRVMRVLALGFFLIPFGSVTEALLRRNLDARRQTIATVVSTVAYSGAVITLAANGFGYMSMAWANFINIICSVITYGCMRPTDQPWLPTLKGWRSIIGFSGGSALSNLMTNVHNALADTLIGRQVDARSVGLFSRANALVELFTQTVMPAINNAAVPVLARNYHERQNISEDLCRSASYLTGLAWPILIVTALFAHDIILVLYGDKWLDCLPVVLPLCIASAARMPFTLTTNALIATGRPYLSVWTVGGTVALKLIIVAIMHANDLRSFAIAFMVADLLALPLFVILWRLQFSVSALAIGRAVLPSLYVSALCAGAAWLIEIGTANISPIPRVALLGLLMSVLWTAIVVGCRHPLRAEIVRLVPGLKGRLQ